MPTILERLHAALQPDYDVELELASGGMGTVFLARDRVLDHRVAVKILRPELATARATERFLREAQLLAHLTHPNVVPVHRAGERDGLSFYVMDYIEGETLAHRLAHGPLSPADALKLGRDLLDALEAVHRLGVIHRDIKPGNVFLLEGRALLADFGIATPSTPDDGPITGEGSRGTPGYMPPEQAFAWDLSPQTDLYAAGMVIYEAFTGRRWQTLLPDEKPDWSGVPRRVVPVLRRALAWDPAARWPDARTFRRALWRTRTRKYRRRTLLLTLGGVTLGAAIGLLATCPAAVTSDLAVLPFAETAEDSTLGEDLATLTRYNLEFFARRVGLRLAHPRDLQQWRTQCAAPPERLTRRCIRRLGAEDIAYGRIISDDGEPVVRLTIISRGGRPEGAGALPLGELWKTAHRLGFLIAEKVKPERAHEYPVATPLPESDPALIAFLQGRRAFQRNAFGTAVREFTRALEIDSAFGLAAWWLSNAWRWNVTGEPFEKVDLRALLATQGSRLPELDSLLIEAQLAPDQRTRLAWYSDAVRRHPRSAYAAFLYGEELQSRGPYVGVGLDASTAQLETALRRDSAFAPTLYHLLWAAIRMGDRKRAEQLLERFTPVAAARDEVRYYQPPLMAFAILERFDPDRARLARPELLQRPDDAASLEEVYRLTAVLGLHRTLVELGELMAARSGSGSAGLGGTHEARGLGRLALGQIARALSHFDTAAALLRTPASRLEAHEWRVLGPALGLAGVPAGEAAAARGVLARTRGARELRARAAWALGMELAARGETVEAERWRDTLRRLEPEAAAVRLGGLLEATIAGAAGAFEQALARSATLLSYDSAGRGGDPFARAALHLLRAAWLDSLGRHEAADSSRLWYEHFEFLGIPSGPAQAAEVDWALSPHVMLLRADQAAARGRRERACHHYTRVLELWAEADPAFRAPVERAAAFVRRSCQ